MPGTIAPMPGTIAPPHHCSAWHHTIAPMPGTIPLLRCLAPLLRRTIAPPGTIQRLDSPLLRCLAPYHCSDAWHHCSAWHHTIAPMPGTIAAPLLRCLAPYNGSINSLPINDTRNSFFPGRSWTPAERYLTVLSLNRTGRKFFANFSILFESSIDVASRERGFCRNYGITPSLITFLTGSTYFANNILIFFHAS